MIDLVKKYRKQIFHWSLALTGMALAFPSYSLVSISVILLTFSRILLNYRTTKYQTFRQNFLPFLAVSIAFWLALTGLLFSGNFQSGLIEIQRKLPLLLLPLILASVPVKRRHLLFVWKYTAYAVVLASLSGIMKAVYLNINGLGNYFYYDKLAVVLVRHTTYFALLTGLAFLYFLYRWLHERRGLWLAGMTYTAVVLYMLSSRMPVVALAVASAFMLYFHLRRRRFWILATIILVVAAVFASPYFKARFHPKTWHGNERNQIAERFELWRDVWQTNRENSPLWGLGTGGDRQSLYAKYRRSGLTAAYREKYNAHNQFLEFLLNNGWTGFLLFLAASGYILWKAWRKDPGLDFPLALMIFLPMLTESVLERLTGIVVYGLFISLIVFEEKYETEN